MSFFPNYPYPSSDTEENQDENNHQEDDVILDLSEILERTNHDITQCDIDVAIKTMEKVAHILTLTNKSLPSAPSFEKPDKLFDLRMAAISLLNRNYKAQNRRHQKQNLKKSQHVHHWNPVQSEHGITKIQAKNCEKWRKVFQPKKSVPSLRSSCDNNQLTASDRVTTAEKQQDESTQYDCYVCRAPYTSKESHHFYPKMCQPCGEVSFQKRSQTANLHGKVALVTGGRIKIGYETVLKLLRCGAKVIITTRFPIDAAKRYSYEEDFQKWKHQLHIYPLDLRFIRHVELFCAHFMKKYNRLDFLIENAAQTIRRPVAWYKHLIEAESLEAPNELLSLVHSWDKMDNGNNGNGFQLGPSENAPQTLNFALDFKPQEDKTVTTTNSVITNHQACLPKSVLASELIIHPEDTLYEKSSQLRETHFPSDMYDEDHQQADLRPVNTWALETDQVETVELLEVNLVNTITPYIILSKLTPLLQKTAKENRRNYHGCVILVSSMEGKFNRLKSTQHPHTNCAKASLNMLARTSGPYYKKLQILLNAVDTGWVTEEEPWAVKMQRYKEERIEFQPPLDSIDGAARVLDPIFTHINDPTDLKYGVFFKDYDISEW